MRLLRRNKWISIVIGVIIMSVWIGWSCFRSKYFLVCTSYDLDVEKVLNPIRILQLTDLHNSVFGDHNRELVALADAQSPDMILITGDLLNSDEARTDIATNLIADLCGIAPVYVSLGNHEIEYQEKYGVDIAELYMSAGAVVLEKSWKDVQINGQSVRIGGIYGYCVPARYLETNEADPEECAFLEAFQDTDAFTLLMCHMPYSWLVLDGLDAWNIDCVMAGHVHGGQIRLPFIGGLYAPDQGWFPGRECGLYNSENGDRTLVLSRGLGNTESIPRLNNPPEVLALYIK